ncbi:SDR family NAD(P)-dependent oxidoreductase [Mycetocola spongiae]|uniref:SDR family NAD(P)-dependent oxidoreductase n=1 Tax=Mycetocola spongiae TaxID=2859226 RepID=UPI001CF14D9B|nr:SDR family oxidoreductase [Mycetocola spongiae]UCR88185.1 SDR family oxidoreductase [Mycetocola spongiae]
MKLGLENKVVLCTGAAGGIGRPTARIFAEEGARVICVDRDASAVEELVASLPGEGHTGIALTVHDRATAEEVVARVLATYGRIDVLAHLAAMLQTVELTEVTEEQWMAHMNVNVNATFFLARAAAEAMCEHGDGGRVTIISSGAWLSGGLSTRLPYATTKGAVTTMARGLAKAYGPRNITVNTIAPGLIDTAMMRDGLTPERRVELEEATPLRRFGTPEEIASVIVFTSSAPASFISGATLNVSGGNTLY